MIPLNADVLMFGVDPEQYDHFQRLVKGGLQIKHMGWSYVANPRNTFPDAMEFVRRRRELDLVFIANQIGLSDSALRQGCDELAQAIAAHPAKPWVVLDAPLQYLKHIFEIQRVNVEQTSIEIGLCERHRWKCEAKANAA